MKIFTATSTHAKNLATFVFIYKSLMAALKQMSGRVMSGHAFIAALIGGYYVFGDNNPVNTQVIPTLSASVPLSCNILKQYVHTLVYCCFCDVRMSMCSEMVFVSVCWWGTLLASDHEF